MSTIKPIKRVFLDKVIVLHHIYLDKEVNAVLTKDSDGFKLIINEVDGEVEGEEYGFERKEIVLSKENRLDVEDRENINEIFQSFHLSFVKYKK